MKKTILDLAAIVGDWVGILSAFVAVTASVLDFIGLLDGWPALKERIPTITLLAIGLVIFSTVIERRTKLAHIETQLGLAIQSSQMGMTYLEDDKVVVIELQNMVKNAQEFIMAVGGKSAAADYLELIRKRVETGETKYYRLITGDHITHVLHEHLLGLLNHPRVKIAWNPSEKFRTFTVTEDQVVVVLPPIHSTRFSGMRLPGDRNVLMHNQFFLETFAKSSPIQSEEELTRLCRQCSKEDVAIR